MQKLSILSLISAVLRRGLGLAGTVKKFGVVGRLVGFVSNCWPPSSATPPNPPVAVAMLLPLRMGRGVWFHSFRV